MQLCLQTEVAEKNQNHFTRGSYCGEHNKSTSQKKKILTPNAIKKFCMQAQNILTNLNLSPAHSKKLSLISNYALRQKFHSKSSTMLA